MAEGNGSKLRRQRDRPILILSQDYELFFQQSGSIEKCLFEPCELLLKFASKNDIKITFFVDAGMLTCMQRIAPNNPSVASQLSRIQSHVESLSENGHEIGLHVHPHWEETSWSDDGWRFSGTRYQLRDFSDDEVGDIFESYASTLNNLSRDPVVSYRAGGFCVEPFARIKGHLRNAGIHIDSSVVPGAKLIDREKGFDFSAAKDVGWWRFDESPAMPEAVGHFLEIPITPNVLPFFYYWGRLFHRLIGRQPAAVLGDGMAKAIGGTEIFRRLAGGSRMAELSTDGPKAELLLKSKIKKQHRDVYQVMGHPKLLSGRSLNALQKFMSHTAIRRTDTLASFATAVGSGEIEGR